MYIITVYCYFVLNKDLYLLLPWYYAVIDIKIVINKTIMYSFNFINTYFIVLKRYIYNNK